MYERPGRERAAEVGDDPIESGRFHVYDAWIAGTEMGEDPGELQGPP